LSGEEVEAIEIPGFLSDQQTFYTGNAVHGQMIQVTPSSVRLISADSMQLLEYVNTCCIHLSENLTHLFKQ
jgi:DNA damage-binding protein 1